MLLVVLLLVTAGSFALFFTATRVAERLLGTERRFGALTVRAYAPEVGPLLTLRADSIAVRGSGFRLLFADPRARLVDWLGLRPSDASLILRADSIAFESLPGGRDTQSPRSLPSTLRFPIKTLFEWRVLTVSVPGAPEFATGPARWESRGAQALHGMFEIRPVADSAGNTLPDVAVDVNARWRGPALRYRVVADAGEELRATVSGIREKRDLRAGFDSLSLFAARPERWASAVRLPPVSNLRVDGKVDWRTDSVRVRAGFVTPERHPAHAAQWELRARAGGNGGDFSVRAEALPGTRSSQSLNARGSWSHAGRWTSFPAWENWRGDFSGTVRGGPWTIAYWTLPLDFDIVDARLDTGLRVGARLATPASSRIEVRWNGRNPDRLEMSGTVSREEPWAVAWTNGHVSYASARVEAVWEDARLRATARVRSPRAYGAFADSLVADNEVTGSGYFLRGTRIFQGGEVFTGSGQVLWRAPSGKHEVSLGFEARHASYGRGSIAMTFPGGLRLTADSLLPARFPHEWTRRAADWEPRLDGTMAWDPETGAGEAGVDVVFHGPDRSGVVHSRGATARMDAAWSRDSARVRTLRVAAGRGRVEASGVLPFDGRRLRWQGPQSLLGGAWRVRADSAQPADIVSLFGGEAPFSDSTEGGLNGTFAFAPSTGLDGALRLDRISFGSTEIRDIALTGRGDTLRAAALASFGARVPATDTLAAILTDLKSGSPRVTASARSPRGIRADLDAVAFQGRQLHGAARVAGENVTLPGNLGTIENLEWSGTVRAPLNRDFLPTLTLSSGRLTFRHVSPHDTITVSGSPRYVDGVLRVPDLAATTSRGDTLSGRVEARPAARSVFAQVAGRDLDVVLPDGGRARAAAVEATIDWTPAKGIAAAATARDGSVSLPPTTYRVETGFEFVNAEVFIPPAGSEAPRRLVARGRLQDFVFQRKWGWRDATSYFTAFNRGGSGGGARAPGKRGGPWELDLAVEATGTRNRVDTDVLRMNFTGDARMTGIYPYTLINGKISGLQGEVGQVRQAFVLRDFEVKWDNVTMEDGTLYVEGEKKLRTDCRTETRQTCQIYVHLDGRLEEVGLSYDTDCGQNTGEPVPPAVLINSMAQGCYVSEASGGEGNYGSAAFAILEPAINERLSREFSRGSGGFIKSTQVSGLSALLGSDSTGLESVALEVESRSVHRVNLKGRAGYHPETKLANPMEYRLAAEYRPPLEKLARDSTWRERLQGRFTVEAAVETRPEGRDVEEERRVRQRAGLRYRHRFWDLW